MGESACYAHMLDDQGRMPDPPRVRIQHADAARQPDPSAIRILVDRTWPRGVAKDALVLDGWIRQLAPTAELRRWFARDPQKWPEFQRRYREELSQNIPELRRLAVLARGGHLVLIYTAHDENHNQAVVLKELLEDAVQENVPIETIVTQRLVTFGLAQVSR